ncbi:MAG: zf-HC2 domain-containing protein [Actinobacteria bacterium]|nr:zf-HC2 domain-containing protein [Actinomycetota bacterium]
MGLQTLLGRHDECRRTLRDLQAYLDGELDETTTWDISRHLSGCEECFGDAEQFRLLKQALSRLRCASDPLALRRLRELVAGLPGSRAGT